MRRSRKHMLKGQVDKVEIYSDRLTFRAPKFMYNYVKYNVQLSSFSRNRWLSDAIVKFGDRLVSHGNPVDITDKQVNEGIYNIIQGTKLPFTMKFESSIALRFTESAKFTANNIVARFLREQEEGEALPKNIKSKLMLIVLLDHMIRHGYSKKLVQLEDK